MNIERALGVIIGAPASTLKLALRGGAAVGLAIAAACALACGAGARSGPSAESGAGKASASKDAHRDAAQPAADPVNAGTAQPKFSGQAAYDYTRRLVELGERTPGSAAHRKAETYIVARLKQAGAQVESDAFTATTPRGPLPMRNIIAKFGAGSDRILLVAGHYDTLFLANFVGANDGGSSPGLLLALGDALSRAQLKSPVWLLFLDGEEAVKQWTATDSLYGSRHLAEKFTHDGQVPRFRALLLVDMIGDKDLDIARETNSTAWLQDFITTAANELGYSSYFFKTDANIQDDHLPFIKAGIPSVDIGDFTYGPVGPGTDAFGKYHHSSLDTMDKISAHSLQIVGDVVLRTVELLQQQ